MSGKPRFNSGFATDIGRKRQQNQDRGGSFPELGLFVVADGMGGHKGGETASSMALELVHQHVKKKSSESSWEAKAGLIEAIRSSNQAIYDKSSHQPELHGMGTTTTALFFNDKILTIGHVGDSRCYYMRPGAIWQLTRDHSLVQEKLRAGLISRDQVKTDRMKNVITRSVGFEAEVNVEIYEMIVQPGDLFLLCSDGLSGLIDDQDILMHVQRYFDGAQDLTKTANDLIHAANQNGGDDNITTVLVQIESDGETGQEQNG